MKGSYRKQFQTFRSLSMPLNKSFFFLFLFFVYLIVIFIWTCFFFSRNLFNNFAIKFSSIRILYILVADREENALQFKGEFVIIWLKQNWWLRMIFIDRMDYSWKNCIAFLVVRFFFFLFRWNIVWSFGKH